MSDRNLLSQRAYARVVYASWAQRVAVGAFYEFEPVTWAYAHCIEEVCRKCDLASGGDLKKHGNSRALMQL